MYWQFVVPAAFVLVLLAACLAAIFWGLASRFDAQECTPEWLDTFSLDSYAPMERLLARNDVEFLASQKGYSPAMGHRLMAERRRIFVGYLSHLVRDFNQLVRIGKLVIVYSAEDRQEFARRLWRQQVRFYAAICSVRIQLALYPLGWDGTDTRRLVEAVTQMRDQVAWLTAPAQISRFETA